VLEISPGAELTVLKQAISKIVTEDDEDVLEDDELEEGVASLDEPIELQSERPITEPTTAITEPAAEPDSSSTPRDSKPPTAD
jgi:chromatin remodeling complex protein RSC6